MSSTTTALVAAIIPLLVALTAWFRSSTAHNRISSLNRRVQGVEMAQSAQRHPSSQVAEAEQGATGTGN